MSWKVNGSTENNNILRQCIIHHLDSDILCLCETHLEGYKSINIDDYEFISNIRKVKHKNAPKLHGSVGMLIKKDLYLNSNIFSIDNNVEGILGMPFVNMATEYNFVIFPCYIAPHDSPYGKDVIKILGHLIAQMYLFNDSDQIYLCGDYNGRIGNLTDIVHEIDSLSESKPLDKIVHGHWESLIELMQDAKQCVLNGRLNSENDNYTCISLHGSFVVDYIITPHDVYYKFQAFHVYTITDMMVACNLASLIGDRYKPSDHSILHVNFNTIDVFNQESNANATFDIESDITEENVYRKRKYRFNNVLHLFMSSDIWKECMAQLTELF